MLPTTENIIRVTLSGDSTITQEDMLAALDLLNGKKPNPVMPTDKPDMVLSRKQVAALLGKSKGAVDIYGRKGVIRRVYLMAGGKQRRQAQGYSRDSVMQAIKNGAGL